MKTIENPEHAYQYWKSKQARGMSTKAGQDKRSKLRADFISSLVLTEYMRQRAMGKVYERFRVNNYELSLLCALVGQSGCLDSYIHSKRDFFDSVTGNRKRKVKMEGFLWGLRNKGMVGSYEWAGNPETLSIGVSQLGWKVVQYYADQLWKLIETRIPEDEYSTVIIPSVDYETKGHKLKVIAA